MVDNAAVRCVKLPSALPMFPPHPPNELPPADRFFFVSAATKETKREACVRIRMFYHQVSSKRRKTHKAAAVGRAAYCCGFVVFPFLRRREVTQERNIIIQ
jgi:hypothetical protein